MARILLVENDSEWRDPIIRALPGYQVDAASTYDEALRLLGEGITYDVAIVDLNLIDSAERNAGDLLGGEVLLQLRRDHSSTRRIALTAWPPGAVRGEVLDRYGVDELLIKGHLKLSDLRQVVRVSMNREAGTPASEALADRSTLREGFRSWRDAQIRTMDQQRRMALNDLHMSAHVARGSAGAENKLAELDKRRAALDSACQRVEDMLADINDSADVKAVRQELQNLQNNFGVAAQS